MTWVSEIDPAERIIGDGTRLTLGERPREGWESRDYKAEPLGYYAPPLGASERIDRAEFYDRAQQLERNRTRLSDFASPRMAVLNQGRTNYCWIAAVVFGAELTRIRQGSDHVRLSPASGGAKIKNFRNVGGWCDQAAKFMESRGIVPAELWPQNEINRRYDTDQAWDEAKRYQLTEWNELRPKNLDDLFSCLLRGLACPAGFSWWRHAVCLVDVVVFDKPRDTSDRELLRCFGVRFANSWGKSYGAQGYGILKGKKQLADGQLCIRSMRVTA